MNEERTPQVGEPAPDFRLPTGDGSTLGLAELRGRPVVLYFYPRDDTPGCTAEACSFRDLNAEFAARGAAIVGVSTDPPSSHRRFAAKHGLTFPLLSDESAEVARAYGVYRLKQQYGRTFWGIERTTFLIDRDGVIRKVYPKVKVEGHAEQVLRDLEELDR